MRNLLLSLLLIMAFSAQSIAFAVNNGDDTDTSHCSALRSFFSTIGDILTEMGPGADLIDDDDYSDVEEEEKENLVVPSETTQIKENFVQEKQYEKIKVAEKVTKAEPQPKISAPAKMHYLDKLQQHALNDLRIVCPFDYAAVQKQIANDAFLLSRTASLLNDAELKSRITAYPDFSLEKKIILLADLEKKLKEIRNRRAQILNSEQYKQEEHQ